MDSKNVAKVVIRNKQGEILVLTRADNGNYDLTGGHMLVGETSIMGAIREVFEETKPAATEQKQNILCIFNNI